jgi:hypothetical protein
MMPNLPVKNMVMVMAMDTVMDTATDMDIMKKKASLKASFPGSNGENKTFHLPNRRNRPGPRRQFGLGARLH